MGPFRHGMFYDSMICIPGVFLWILFFPSIVQGSPTQVLGQSFHVVQCLVEQDRPPANSLGQKCVAAMTMAQLLEQGEPIPTPAVQLLLFPSFPLSE